MRNLIYAGAVLAAFAVSASAQQSSRFQGMDRNGDGRISREEWRGNPRSFARHDWNNDGELSGDEVRAAAAQRDRADNDNDRTANDGFDSENTDWTDDHFRYLDTNDDNRLTQAEWRYNIETYRRIDRNRDGYVSRAEFLGIDITDDGRGERFDDIDTNRDGRVSPGEWLWSRAAFERRDTNRDGILTRDELTRRVPGGSAGTETRSRAYQNGYAQGLTEGREAGREDKQLRNQWDLEGQRELEQADSGYRQELGTRADYQAGYRAGFRTGYAEGFGRR
jgi:Ca2+-binding EF-hand superfamily protein